MTDQYIQVPLDATGNSSGASGKKIDTSELTVGANTVERQRVVIADPTTAAGLTSVKGANTSPTLADGAQVTVLSPNNTGLAVNIPVIVQKTANASSGSVASLSKAFTSNNAQGNTIIIVFGNGNNNAAATPVADTAGNTYFQVVLTPNSTAFQTGIYYAVNIASGANTVTVTPGGTNASIAMEIYEVSGLLTVAAAQPDEFTSASGTSGTAVAPNIVPTSSNVYAFAGVSIGTAAQTIIPATSWTNDSGQQNPTTPTGLFSFISMSQYCEDVYAITPQATFTSEPWSIVSATFTPVMLGISGVIRLTDGTNNAKIDTNGQLLTSSLGVTLGSTNQVSVANTATQITAANTDQVAVLIANPAGGQTVYIGLAGVTTSTGLVLASGASITIPTISAVYGIVASSTQTVSFISLTE